VNPGEDPELGAASPGSADSEVGRYGMARSCREKNEVAAMRMTLRACLRWWYLLAMSGWLLEGGCAGVVQRELEVLLRPEANPTLIRQSYLIDLLGPEILKLFM